MLIFLITIALSGAFTHNEKEEVCLRLSSSIAFDRKEEISAYSLANPQIPEPNLKMKLSDDIYHLCMNTIDDNDVDALLTRKKVYTEFANSFQISLEKYKTPEDIKGDRHILKHRREISKRINNAARDRQDL